MVRALCFIKDCAWEQEGFEYMDAALDAIRTHYRRDHPRKVFNPDTNMLEFFNYTPDELEARYRNDAYYIEDVIRSYNWRLNPECQEWWNGIIAQRAQAVPEGPRRGGARRFQGAPQAAFFDVAMEPPGAPQGDVELLEALEELVAENDAPEQADDPEDGGF
ncbi:MAG TPA: hypothetical protein VIY48_10490 [Candidatus Paceibacterota bacterium]